MAARDKIPVATDFFLKDSEKDAWICQIVIEETEEVLQRCHAEIKATDDVSQKGTRAFNLKRHIQRAHREEFSDWEKKLKAQELQKKASGPSRSSAAAPRQTSLSAFYQSDKVTISMTPAIFKDFIVKMVVKEGVNIRLFSSNSYRQSNGELAKKLGVSLDRDKVRQYVLSAAASLKEDIQKAVQNKIVFLKFDCATRIQTSYLGVNIRYVDSKNKPVTKTLMVIDTHNRHTSIELKVLINKSLAEFHIAPRNVLCCVTDNASNMVKLVKDFNHELEEEALQQDSDTSSDEDDDQEQDDPDAALDLDNALISSLPVPSHVRCGMHTLQVCVDTRQYKKTFETKTKVLPVIFFKLEKLRQVFGTVIVYYCRIFS